MIQSNTQLFEYLYFSDIPNKLSLGKNSFLFTINTNQTTINLTEYSFIDVIAKDSENNEVEINFLHKIENKYRRIILLLNNTHVSGDIFITFTCDGYAQTLVLPFDKYSQNSSKIIFEKEPIVYISENNIFFDSFGNNYVFNQKITNNKAQIYVKKLFKNIYDKSEAYNIFVNDFNINNLDDYSQVLVDTQTTLAHFNDKLKNTIITITTESGDVYKSKIKNIIGSNVLEIEPIIEIENSNSAININYSCDYLLVGTVDKTKNCLSYVNFDIQNFATDSGFIDTLKIYYKPSFADRKTNYSLFDTIKLHNKNLFSSNSSTDLIEQYKAYDIGKFYSLNWYNTHWNELSNDDYKNNIWVTNKNIVNAIKFESTVENIVPNTFKKITALKNETIIEDYNSILQANSEYSINFKYFNTHPNTEIKVFATHINTEESSTTQFLIKHFTKLRIGDINSIDISFIPPVSGLYTLQFEVKTTVLYLSDISITYNLQNKINPNRYVASTIFSKYNKRNTYYDFLIEYYNEVDIKSEIIDEYANIFITGSNINIGEVSNDAIGGWKVVEDGFESFTTYSLDDPKIKLNSEIPELNIGYDFIIKPDIRSETSGDIQSLYTGLQFYNNNAFPDIGVDYNIIASSISRDTISEEYDYDINKLLIYLGTTNENLGIPGYVNNAGTYIGSHIILKDSTGLIISGVSARFTNLWVTNNTLFKDGTYIDIVDWTADNNYSWEIKHSNAPSLINTQINDYENTEPYNIISSLTRDNQGHITDLYYYNLKDDLFGLNKLISSIHQIPDILDAAHPLTRSLLLYNPTRNGYESYSLNTFVGLFNNIENTETLENKDVLIYNSTTSKFNIRNLEINDISNVTTSGLIASQSLLYINGQFRNAFNKLSILSDVNVTGLNNDNILKWNTATGKWLPSSIGGLADIGLHELSNVNLNNSFDTITNRAGIYWNDSIGSFEFKLFDTLMFESVGTGTDNDIIVYDSSNLKLKASSASSLGLLSTSNISGTGYIQWNGSNLTAANINLANLADVTGTDTAYRLLYRTTQAAGSSNAYQLSSITDILSASLAGTIANNAVLQFNGTNYIATNKLDIGSLNRVSLSGLVSNDVLQYNGTNFVNVPFGALSISFLREIGNVSNVEPTNNQFLVYVAASNEYQNKDLNYILFSNLGDTNISTPINYQSLMFESSKWKNVHLSESLRKAFGVNSTGNNGKILGINSSNELVFSGVTSFLSESRQLNDITHSGVDNVLDSVLAWNGTVFEPKSLGSIGVSSILDIGDVDSVNPPLNNNILVYDDSISKFVLRNFNTEMLNDITLISNVNFSTESATVNSILAWNGDGATGSFVETDIFDIIPDSIDVTLTDVEDGQILVWSSESLEFINVSLSEIGLEDKSIQALQDVSNGTIENGDLMIYSGSHGIDGTFAFISTESLFETIMLQNLADIDSTNISDNSVLIYNSGIYKYINTESLVVNINNLEDIDNVDETTIGNNKLLIYDASTSKHIYIDSSSIGTSINSLLDIADVEGSPSNGNILQYNSSTELFEWVVPAGGVGLTSILDIPDVNTLSGTPANGDILRFNSVENSFELESLSNLDSGLNIINIDYVLDSNLRGYYKYLYEDSPNVTDYSSYEHHISTINNVVINENNYLEFSGLTSNMYLVTDNTLSGISVSDTLTLIFNIKFNSIVASSVLISSTNAFEIGLNNEFSSPTLYFSINIGTNTVYTVDTNINPNTTDIYSIALVYDSDNKILKCYVNNLLVGDYSDITETNYNFYSLTNSIIFGNCSTTFNLYNTLIWNKAISLDDLRKFSINTKDNLDNSFNFNSFRLINNKNNNVLQYLSEYYLERNLPANSNNIFIDEINNYAGNYSVLEHIDNKNIDIVEWYYVIKSINEFQSGIIRCNIQHSLIEIEKQFEHKRDDAICKIKNVKFDYKFLNSNNTILLLVDNTSNTDFYIKIKTKIL